MRDDVVVAALVTRARDGDKQAWDALVDRYAPLVWCICRRHRLGHADAEDVGQSVWLHLVSQLDKIRDPAALPGWLATATQRECLRVLRTVRGPQAARYVHSAVFTYLKSGRLDEAGRASAQAIETAIGLTPHHRLHAAAWQTLLGALAGRWDEVRARAAGAERTVDANHAAATPCVLDVSVLLNCATASALAGDEDEARRLERKAHDIGMEGGRWYQGWLDPPQMRLALARHDLNALAELAAHDLDWEWEPASTFLDALAALGDRERIEAEAPKWLQPGTFSEPFALRSLGVVRDDRPLLDQALARFQALGLSWHAEQTRRLAESA